MFAKKRLPALAFGLVLLPLALPGLGCGSEDAEPSAAAKPPPQAPAAPARDEAAIRWADGLMRERDANGDGRITLAEFTIVAGADRAEAARRSFGYLDTNADGAVTADEVQSFRKSKEGGG